MLVVNCICNSEDVHIPTQARSLAKAKKIKNKEKILILFSFKALDTWVYCQSYTFKKNFHLRQQCVGNTVND